MKLFLIVCTFACASLYAQDAGLGAQFSLGYIPNQELSVTSECKAFTFDATGWVFAHLHEDFFSLGLGGGLGIRHYTGIPNDALLTADPYTESATRFDLHAGPGIGFGHRQYCFFVISPQLGLWYAGMSNEGPKVKFITSVNLDVIFGRIVSLGITYRGSSRLVSTDWKIYDPHNSFILVQPALEFRIGIFAIGSNGD